MNIRLMLVAGAMVCGLAAPQAHAGSIYYSNEATASGGEYSAGASDEPVAAPAPRATHRAAAAAVVSPLGPDGYLPVEKSTSFYNHAEGTMGAP